MRNVVNPENLDKAKQQLAELLETLKSLRVEWHNSRDASEAIADAQQFAGYVKHCLHDVY